MILISLILNLVFSWHDIHDLNDKKLEAFYNQDPIKMEYLNAMEAFLTKDSMEAEKKFLLLMMKSYDQNWTFEQRRLLVYSHLRYCQIRKENCDNIYRDIARFDSEMIAHIEESLFPPPMLEKALLAKSKEEQNQYIWQPGRRWQNAKYILVNGKVYFMNKDLKLPLNLEKNRVVMIDNQYNKETFIGSTKELLNFKPKSGSFKKIVNKPDLKSISPNQKTIKTNLKEDTFTISKKEIWTYSIIGAVITYLVYENQKDDGRNQPIHTSKN